MRVLQIFNNYRSGGGGEKRVVELTKNILTVNGHNVQLIERDSNTIKSLSNKISAFKSSIYSMKAKKETKKFIKIHFPEIAHIHNLYPLLSPSVIIACRRFRIPMVMSIHHFGLTCPSLHHFDGNDICTKCLHKNEIWCILKNCRRNISESIAYAIRSMIARKMKIFNDCIDVFITSTNFMKTHLVNAGFKKEKFCVIPNAINSNKKIGQLPKDQYIAYVGRLSSEKGIEILLKAAKESGLPVKIAGKGPIEEKLKSQASMNVKFVGHLNGEKLIKFYKKAKFLVLPSICLEAFGLVIIEAMKEGLPVLASRIGGIPEIIDDGISGLLFEAGNAADLENKMTLLWNNNDLCRKFANAGRTKIGDEFSEETYYKRLMRAYSQAIESNYRS
jgi:glycosyltransferase involved in cell wall biosynthesis